MKYTAKNILRAFSLVTVVMFLGSVLALAQTYPNRPLKIVVPFGPGSGTDVATRLLARELETTLKQVVTVENRPGASGSIAAIAVARAAPDGYTLMMGTNSTHGANPGLIAKLQYDPVKDFAPIGMVATFSSFLVVHPSVPARTTSELIAYAKANPKALSFAAGNTSSLMMGEMFARRTGIEMLRVPYSSNPAGLTDVMAGRVQVMFPDVSSSQAHVKSGALRPLAVVTLGERMPQTPDVPTIEETGVNDFKFVGWIGLFAPEGTPEYIQKHLADELQRAVGKPEMTQHLRQLGADAQWMGPAEFRKYVRSEVTRLPKLLADIGVKPQ